MQKEVRKLEELEWGGCTGVGVLQGVVSWAWSLGWGRAHCGRSTARRSGGGWCRRWSREPSPGHTAVVAAAARAVSPRAPLSAQGTGGAELGSAFGPGMESPLTALPSTPQIPASSRIQGPALHAILTTFLISEAWIVGSQGKMTVFFSALRSGSRVCLPWEKCPHGENTERPLPFPSALLEREATQGAEQGTLGRAAPTHQLLPAFIDLTEVGADVDVVEADVPVIAVHIGEAPVDEGVSIASRFTHPQPWVSLMHSKLVTQHALSTICVLGEEGSALPSSSPRSSERHAHTHW